MRAGSVFVVTCAVPAEAARDLSVTVSGRTVTAACDGFRREVELPPEADAERLRWEVYADVLELRAPYGDVPLV